MAPITLTDEATEVLKRLLDESQAESQQILRLIDRGHGNLALDIGPLDDGDQVVKVNGQPVLAISYDVANLIEGSTIAVTDTSEGKGLSIILRKS
jgi:hypothetical protein